MYIFNLFYSLPSYNPSFLICLCFNMVSIRSQKKAWATPRSVSFTGLIQNFRRASPPLSYAESPPPPPLGFPREMTSEERAEKFHDDHVSLPGNTES